EVIGRAAPNTHQRSTSVAWRSIAQTRRDERPRSPIEFLNSARGQRTVDGVDLGKIGGEDAREPRNGSGGQNGCGAPFEALNIVIENIARTASNDPSVGRVRWRISGERIPGRSNDRFLWPGIAAACERCDQDRVGRDRHLPIAFSPM